MVNAGIINTPVIQSSNIYGVRASKWRKWGPIARTVFNSTYRTMLDNDDFFLHPTLAAVINRDLFSTTCWNAAWVAAEAVEKATKKELVEAAQYLQKFIKEIDDERRQHS